MGAYLFNVATFIQRRWSWGPRSHRRRRFLEAFQEASVADGATLNPVPSHQKYSRRQVRGVPNAHRLRKDRTPGLEGNRMVQTEQISRHQSAARSSLTIFSPRRKREELGRRPSSLGLDHACVYIKKPLRPPLTFLTARRPQNNDTFFLCSWSRNMSSALLSPLDYTCSSKGTHTNKHVRTYNEVSTRDISSLKTAPRPLPT